MVAFHWLDAGRVPGDLLIPDMTPKYDIFAIGDGPTNSRYNLLLGHGDVADVLSGQTGRLFRMKFQFRSIQIDQLDRNVLDWGFGGCRNGDIGRAGHMTNRNSILVIIKRQDR
jgi:hypothetical protein